MSYLSEEVIDDLDPCGEGDCASDESCETCPDDCGGCNPDPTPPPGDPCEGVTCPPDGYVGEPYCKNGDVYQKYRNYYCENGEYKYSETEIEIDDCGGAGCENGGCIVDPCGEDKDGDGVGWRCDICPGHDDKKDGDNDGVPDGCDICSGHDDKKDYDTDGVPDGCDECPELDGSSGRRGNGCPCDVNKKHELEKLEKELRHQAEIKDDYGCRLLNWLGFGFAVLGIALAPFTGGTSLVILAPSIMSFGGAAVCFISSEYEHMKASELREEADRIGGLASQYTDGC